ncbi:MAG TPA: isopentenyl-diphosphate Delta-isomerase [Candidatus Deferrimicrobium sp.]|nr:isopentenyl-diphosphate Delta-isomerase [Candidatus Deferrimicrobium sp.]
MMNDELKARYALDHGADTLILVDGKDNIVGYLDKGGCHEGEGVLHRAFSIFIFNSRGELLLQRRSAAKPLWPLFLSNSVCSHPRRGESYEEATHRRLKEELGIETRVFFLFKFEYRASYGVIGSENELCSVFIGKWDGPVVVDPGEIAEWQFIDLQELDKELRVRPEVYTPWFKMEWQRIRENHMKEIGRLLGNN